jgi:hypothetical protein
MFVAAILKLGSRGEEEDATERFASMMTGLRQMGLLPPRRPVAADAS